MKSNHRPIVRLALLLAGLAILSATLFGQVLKGSISGTVVDPQGAVVSGAQVKAIHAATGAVLTTTTDSAGLFRFSLIPVGEYRIEISAQGFKTSTQSNISVAASRDSGVGTIALSVGEISTEVEVNATTPLIETTQSQITNTFTGNTLTTTAGITANEGLDNLALFVPGVVAARDNGFSNSNGGGGFSVNGLRGRNNDQQIDGQNNNDNSVGGPGLFVSDSEFVQQYVLISNQFGPEYGRNAGSVVNVITKSGSNAWHGSVYANENNTVMNSMTNFQRRFGTDANGNPLTSIPRANDEFAGFTVGGPMMKNKAFIFGGFDEEIVSQKSLFTTGLLTPTPQGLAALAACFPGSQSLQALQKFGPYGVSAGNPTPVVPEGGLVNASALCPAATFAGVERTLPTNAHIFNWLMRADVQLGSDTIVGRYLFNRNNFFNTDQGDAAAGFPISVPALSQAVLIGDTHNFNSHTVNEARLSFGRSNVQFGTNTIGTVPGINAVDQAITQTTFLDSTLLPFGLNPIFPQGRIVNTWQVQDNLNYVTGKHTIKAGMNYTYQKSPNIFLPNVNGVFRFADWDAFLQNTPNRVRVANGNPSLDFREHDTFIYGGDDWKVNRSLTVNLGLTWSYYGQPVNLFHDITTKRESNPATAFWNPAVPFNFRTSPSLSSVKNSWGPAIGFAYNPQWNNRFTGNGKTTIRGGYRLLYDPPFYNIYLNIANSAPVVFLQTFTGAAITPNMTLPASPFGPNVRNEVAGQLQRLVFDPRTNNETSVSHNFGPDKVHTWNLGIERELTNNSAVEVRYVGNHATNLFQTINGNPIVANNPFAPANVRPCTTPGIILGPGQTTNPALGRADCNQGIVRQRNNGAFSNYNAVQTEFRANNLFKQLSMRVGYTYSKDLDATSEIFSTGLAGNTLAFAQNPWNPSHAEYSFSGLDIPNQISLLFNEELPFLREQHGVIGHILGGWQVSANYVWATGQRYTPAQFGEEAALSQAALGRNPYDFNWLNAFAGTDLARPFVGNLSAPASSVGIFAGDACNFFTPSDPVVAAATAACNISPTTLISLNAANGSGAGVALDGNGNPIPAVAVNSKQVRYIVNAGVAQQVFGTPFGAPRNLSQDAAYNVFNASLLKSVRVAEHRTFEFRATALNVFNNSFFRSIDPFLEDAGVPPAPGVGFGDPTVTDNVPSGALGNRIIKVGLTFRF